MGRLGIVGINRNVLGCICGFASLGYMCCMLPGVCKTSPLACQERLSLPKKTESALSARLLCANPPGVPCPGHSYFAPSDIRIMVKAARAPPDSVSFCLILYSGPGLVTLSKHTTCCLSVATPDTGQPRCILFICPTQVVAESDRFMEFEAPPQREIIAF